MTLNQKFRYLAGSALFITLLDGKYNSNVAPRQLAPESMPVRNGVESKATGFILRLWDGIQECDIDADSYPAQSLHP